MRQDIDFFSVEDANSFRVGLFWISSLIILSIALFLIVYFQYLEMEQSKLDWEYLNLSTANGTTAQNDLSVPNVQNRPAVKISELMAHLMVKQSPEIEISDISVNISGGITIVGFAKNTKALSNFLLEIESIREVKQFSEYSLSIKEKNPKNSFFWEARWQ